MTAEEYTIWLLKVHPLRGWLTLGCQRGRASWFGDRELPTQQYIKICRFYLYVKGSIFRIDFYSKTKMGIIYEQDRELYS